MDFKHFIYITVIVLLIVLIIVLIILFVNQKNEKYETKETVGCSFQKLWQDHVWYTRYFMLNVLDKYPKEAQDASLARLMQNQVDINNAFQAKYGNFNNQLQSLLETHIKIAGDVLNNLINGDKQNLDKNLKLWTENDDKIATFLHPILNIDAKDISALLHEHMENTINEAQYHFSHDYESEVKNMNSVVETALKIANAF